MEKVFDDRSGKRRVTGPIEYANDGDNADGVEHRHRPRPQQRAAEGRVRAREAARSRRRRAAHVQAGAEARRLEQRRQSEQQSGSVPLRRDGGGECRCRSAAGGRARHPASSGRRANAPSKSARVFSYWRTTVPEWQEENRRIEALWQSHPQGATQLALVEREKLRKTHRLDRGNFLAPAEEVTPGVPAFLHPLEKQRASGSAQPTRLDFARWLVDRRSPTTARSIVNRIWQAYFGTGLVATAEDLGTQGEPPSHPELLGLAGGRVDGSRLEPEAHSSIDRDFGDVSAIERSDAGVAGTRSGQSAAGPRAAVSRRCRSRARRRARRPAGC